MQVGDLVRVLVHWGKIGTVDVIVSITNKFGSDSPMITLRNGWEYHPHELEVISEAR